MPIIIIVIIIIIIIIIIITIIVIIIIICSNVFTNSAILLILLFYVIILILRIKDWLTQKRVLCLISHLSIYTFFDIKVKHLEILFFKIVISLSATRDFPPLCFEEISAVFFSNHDFIDLL